MIWLRTLLFALTFVATVLVLVPRWILGAAGRAQIVTGPARYGAVLLIGAGVSLMVWCWYEFVERGRGTPMPLDPPRRLVVVGPYRYVRNPMYLSVTLIVLGEALLVRSGALLVYWAVWFGVVNLFVLGYEEPALRRRFGAEYERYREAVGRWLPRVRRLHEGSGSGPA